MNDPNFDPALHAAQRKAATRTAAILGIIALAIYAWVFIARVMAR